MSIPTVQFSFPTPIDFGPGTIRNLPKWIQTLNSTRPLVVTDPGLAELSAFDSVTDSLKDAGIEFEVYAQISPNPTDVEVHRGADFYTEQECDLIIGVGGGSALDGAKGVALMASHTGSILDYDDADGGSERITAGIPPVIAIPTTAGTGSEVGRSTVVIDTNRNVKVVVFSPFLMPQVAIIDPELHVSMPSWLTAATGMDALTHNVEALLSKGFHPMADGIALSGILQIASGLERAYSDGSDLQARSAMAIAALMGATAFQKGLGVIHSLAHPCSTVAGVHHGLANGVLIETGLRFNREVCTKPLALIARALALPGDSADHLADATIDWVTQLRDRVDIPGKLRDVGVTRDMLEEMRTQALADGCHLGNPRPVDAQHIHALYEQAF